MGNEKWEMKNEKWGMKNGKGEGMKKAPARLFGLRGRMIG